jgi:hypothetical protein
LASPEEKESIKAKRLAAFYNMIPNLVWTILFVLPVFIYCYNSLSHRIVFVLLGISIVPLFFPNSFLDAIQLSRNSAFYKRIGVKYINKFAQNGRLLNQYMRRKYPSYNSFTTKKSSIINRYHQTYFFEKFHFSLFIFFSFITIHALTKRDFLWALTLSVCNLLYNIYPNLLQQYIRLTLAAVIKRL